MNLKDKVVVITGSSSNIGEATAKLFAKHGAKIVINCKTNIEGAERVVNDIKKQKGEAFFVKAI